MAFDPERCGPVDRSSDGEYDSKKGKDRFDGRSTIWQKQDANERPSVYSVHRGSPRKTTYIYIYIYIHTHVIPEQTDWAARMPSIWDAYVDDDGLEKWQLCHGLTVHGRSVVSYAGKQHCSELLPIRWPWPIYYNRDRQSLFRCGWTVATQHASVVAPVCHVHRRMCCSDWLASRLSRDNIMRCQV